MEGRRTAAPPFYLCIRCRMPPGHTQNYPHEAVHELTNVLFCVWPVHILKTIHMIARKAVYRFSKSIYPYTNRPIWGLFSGPGPSKMCMKSRNPAAHTQGAPHLLRSKPAAFAQRAPHLLRSKPAAFAQRAPHLLRSKPTSFTKRGCCSAPGAPALSPGHSHSLSGSIYRRSCADGDQCFRPNGNAVRSEGSIIERRDRLADTVSSKESERECTDDIWGITENARMV